MKGVKVRNLRLALLVVLGLTMWAKASDAPSSETIWQIGRFDTSSAEFASGATPNPAPVYVIGVSQPDKDWYAFQPAQRTARLGTSRTRCASSSICRRRQLVCTP